MTEVGAGRRLFPALAAATLSLAPAAPCIAQEEGAIAWELGAGIVRRGLHERASNGATLVSEAGQLARLELRARPRGGEASRWEARAALAQGRIDYAGQTQSGQPLSTGSRHTEQEVGLRWRPLEATQWGELHIGLDGLRHRRAIASTATVGGISETSTLLMPAIAWRAPPAQWGAVTVRLEAQARASVRHRLRVDYLGAFDESALEAGRRVEAGLRLSAGFNDSWQACVQWSRARQFASNSVALYGGGIAAGTVRQPELRIDDVSLLLSRSF